MKPRKQLQTPQEFLRQIKTRAFMFGKPQIVREENTVACLFNHRGSVLKGAISFPSKSLADDFEAKLRSLYPVKSNA